HETPVDAVVECHQGFHRVIHRAPPDTAPVSSDWTLTAEAGVVVAFAGRSTSQTLPLSAAKASPPAWLSFTFSVTLVSWFCCWLLVLLSPAPLAVLPALSTGTFVSTSRTNGCP